MIVRSRAGADVAATKLGEDAIALAESAAGCPMKASVSAAVFAFMGCRRGALRASEQRLTFKTGDKPGGAHFEFEQLGGVDEVLSAHHVDIDTEFNVLAAAGKHAAGEFVITLRSVS